MIQASCKQVEIETGDLSVFFILAVAVFLIYK